MSSVGDWLAALPPAELLSPWALALLGLAIGSFLNVVVHRLPTVLERQWWADVAAQLGDAESHARVFAKAPPEPLGLAGGVLEQAVAELPPLGLSRPASRCPHCGHVIRWYENIPLLSWLVLRARCSACGARIALRYPLVEAATAALFAAFAWKLGPQPAVLMWCAVGAVLLALALIDWDTTVLPDVMTQPLLWAGMVAAALGWLPGLTLSQSLWGACAGYLALWSVYLVFKFVTGREGMGYGDFKLLAALGAWLGWEAILPITLIASLLGAPVGLAMKYGGSLREGQFVPFGPFLAGAGLFVMFAGVVRVQGWLDAAVQGLLRLIGLA